MIKWLIIIMAARKKGVSDLAKLVTVTTFFDANEAHITKGLLESEGIEAWIFDELSAAYTPIATGGIRLVVKQTDLARARELLSLID